MNIIDGSFIIENFEMFSDAPKVIEFYSRTCPACQKFEPVYQEVAEANPSIEFYQVDIGGMGNKKRQEIFKTWKLIGVPTTLFFTNRANPFSVSNRITGNQTKEVLESLIKGIT